VRPASCGLSSSPWARVRSLRQTVAPRVNFHSVLMMVKKRVVVFPPASEPRPCAQGWRPGEAGTSGSELPTGTAGTRASGRSSRLSSRGSGALPRVVATETWAIAPEEITICHHPDGSEWELGAGAYGRVFRGIWCMQAVAVKQARARALAPSLWEMSGLALRPVRSARFQNGLAQRRVTATGPVGWFLPAPASPDAPRTSAPPRGAPHRVRFGPHRGRAPQVNRSSEKVDADFLTEISVLKECRNPNIVQVGSAVTCLPWSGLRHAWWSRGCPCTDAHQPAKLPAELERAWRRWESL